MVLRKLTPLAASFLLTLMVGCATTQTSHTARTAKEQMLLSNAVDRSLNKVDFAPLAHQKVFVEEKYLECIDKPYVVGSVRHRVMRAGAQLMEKVEDADVVMELRSGGVGTDSSESFLGTPEIALPGMLTVPEIRVAERKTQYGYAKIGMLIYDSKTRDILGEGGLAMAESDDNNWTIFGVGPYQNGSLSGDVSRARDVPDGARQRQMATTVAFTAPANTTATGQQQQPLIQFASQSEEKKD